MTDRTLIVEYRVRIYEDYYKLTDEQKEQTDKTDKDPVRYKAPDEKGLQSVIDILNDIPQQGCFNYLGEGRHAIDIEIVDEVGDVI